MLEEGLLVLATPAEPHKDSFSRLIHGCHVFDLVVPLGQISLVDAYCVDPEATSLTSLAQFLQAVPQVLADSEDRTIDIDWLGVLRRALHVGQRCEFVGCFTMLKLTRYRARRVQYTDAANRSRLEAQWVIFESWWRCRVGGFDKRSFLQ